jgi:hypothetical protein
MSRHSKIKPKKISQPVTGLGWRHIRKRDRWGVVFALGLTLLLLLALGFVGWKVANHTREAAVSACLSSAHAALEQLPPDQVRRIVTPVGNWQLVAGAATDQLFALARPRNCDGINPKVPLLDRWGSPIRIEIRLEPSGKIDFRVASVGPDKLLNTLDDLRFPPYDAKAIL